MPTISGDGSFADGFNVNVSIEPRRGVERTPPLDVAGAVTATELAGTLTTVYQPNVNRLADHVFIGDAEDTDVTIGLTINQGSNDDWLMALKSSDVAHARTGMLETDSFAAFSKAVAAFGGLLIRVVGEDDASLPNPFRIEVHGGQAQTSKTSGGRCLMEMEAREHDGANANANITADGSVFGVRGFVGGAQRTLFIVDEDGDLFADGGTTTTAVTVFDEHEDAELVRALDTARAPDQAIRSKWDEQVRYGEADLIAAGVLGAPIADGGLINVTQLQRLHNGAIWQGHCERQELKTENDQLRARLDRVEKLLCP